MGITVTREEAVWLRKQHPSGRIVAACGCFDIFHIGHLEYLEAAARLAMPSLWGSIPILPCTATKDVSPIFICRTGCGFWRHWNV